MSKDDVLRAIDRAPVFSGKVTGFSDGVVDVDDLESPDVDDLELAMLALNDLGNAERLSQRFGHNLAHVPNIGWFAWDGRRWSLDAGPRLARMFAHETARRIRDEADALKEARVTEERIERHYKFANTSGNGGRLEAMLSVVEPYLTRRLEELDANSSLFNVPNGTLDLATGQLRPHRREDWITHMASVEWDPDADCPMFRDFLSEIQPDTELQVFLQNFYGYALTGDVSEQVVLVQLGLGANGKSVINNLITRILGDYAAALPIQSLLHSKFGRGGDPSPDLARLPGIRLVTTSEPDTGSRFSESTIKILSGGERLIVRRLRQEFFEFVPQFTIVVSANNRPAVRGQDEGIWRRLLLLPFSVTIPREQRDRRLGDRLMTEAPGILVWLVHGAKEWHLHGLSIPDGVRAATEEYQADSDPLRMFLEERTVRAERGRIQAKTLYGAYVEWSKANHVQHIVSSTAFGRMLPERGYDKVKSGEVYYIGLELNPDDTSIDESGGWRSAE